MIPLINYPYLKNILNNTIFPGEIERTRVEEFLGSEQAYKKTNSTEIWILINFWHVSWL